MKVLRTLVCTVMLCALALLGLRLAPEKPPVVPLPPPVQQEQQPEAEPEAAIPAYSGQPWVQVGDGTPRFTEAELTAESFESYSPLDALGRCGAATSCIGPDLMPTEEREAIGMVRPSGWQLVKYDFVDGKYLYNRCHLIGFQLTGENANEQNLITGTRYMNTEGMLPFENQVARYIRKTGNHVLYRVTPEFDGENLLCTGVRMEALSVEDGGEGVRFHIFAYNVQPGVTIDYATGDSRLTDETAGETAPAEFTYILNTRSLKFHDPGCTGAADISESNRQSYTGKRETLIAEGYVPCGICQP